MTVLHENMREQAWNFVHDKLYADAFFIAEILHKEDPSEETHFLILSVYFHQNKFKAVKDLYEKEEKFRSSKTSLLYARSCIKLNKYSEAEKTLTKTGSKSSSMTCIIAHIKKNFKGQSWLAFSELSKCYVKSDHVSKAEKCLTEALHLNPLLLSAYNTLCQISPRNHKPNPDDFYNNTSFYNLENENIQMKPSTQQAHNTSKDHKLKVLSQVELNNDSLDVTNHSLDYINSSRARESYGHHTPSLSFSKLDTSSLMSESKFKIFKPPSSQWETTVEEDSSFAFESTRSHVKKRTKTQSKISTSLLSSSEAPFIANISGVSPLPQTPASSTIHQISGIGHLKTPEVHVTPEVNAPSQINPPKMLYKKNPQVPTRQSKRVMERSKLSVPGKPNIYSSTPNESIDLRRSKRISAAASHKENSKNSRSKNPIALRGSRSLRTKTVDTDLDSKSSSESGTSCKKPCLDSMMLIMRQIAHATRAMSRFECKKVLDYLQDIPDKYQDHYYVILLKATAYFEINSFAKSKKHFEELRSKHPYRLEGMAVYSSCLWQLNEQYALSTLATQLHDTDPHSAETWCVIGNCFSLQRENPTAIKFLKRAVQLDPHHTYAYTLLGHEYRVVEDHDRAMAAFETASRVDTNNYKAWYGMSVIHTKSEDFSKAEQFLDKALDIHGSSPTLMCHKAVAYQNQNKLELALELLDVAMRVEPKNALCKFTKSTILYALNNFEGALNELKQLINIAPTESTVHFLLGKVYLKIGQNGLATNSFSKALDLDPSGSNNFLKKAIENAHQTTHA